MSPLHAVCQLIRLSSPAPCRIVGSPDVSACRRGTSRSHRSPCRARAIRRPRPSLALDSPCSGRGIGMPPWAQQWLHPQTTALRYIKPAGRPMFLRRERPPCSRRSKRASAATTDARSQEINPIPHGLQPGLPREDTPFKDPARRNRPGRPKGSVNRYTSGLKEMFLQKRRSHLGQNPPPSPALGCLLSPGADMVVRSVPWSAALAVLYRPP
jgi:hypothetical protein